MNKANEQRMNGGMTAEDWQMIADFTTGLFRMVFSGAPLLILVLLMAGAALWSLASLAGMIGLKY